MPQGASCCIHFEGERCGKDRRGDTRVLSLRSSLLGFAFNANAMPAEQVLSTCPWCQQKIVRPGGPACSCCRQCFKGQKSIAYHWMTSKRSPLQLKPFLFFLARWPHWFLFRRERTGSAVTRQAPNQHTLSFLCAERLESGSFTLYNLVWFSQ